MAHNRGSSIAVAEFLDHGDATILFSWDIANTRLVAATCEKTFDLTPTYVMGATEGTEKKSRRLARE
ncbi:hypothetical protein HBI56_045090 [Parastagonospora nodorum]|nr:hypothetical protein HBH56_058210 [Parastagonospora nodorum]KAH3930966.1 hypothetical protein HBH54_102140 [Parastagonospora nodorum]KAH3977533.1 hypothetical protein HBH52_111240 [Parastagonospora nodorum]KAH4121211.1 hypothetical protein HBH47_099100 [Parastagonospora nodorum]KAH4178425.1 hypothetical protein HBH43_023980 [Parastagonospora nodorum]